jgi:phosphoglycerate kinase
MQRELESGLKARENAKRPNIYILGGAKPDDVLKLMRYALNNQLVDKVLTSGVIGELCLIARGSRLPEAKMEELEKNGFLASLQTVRNLIHEQKEFIETPFDFAVAENGKRKEVMLTQLLGVTSPVGDIGTKTAAKYGRIVAKAATVYVKGPCGKYEEAPFEHGTRTVFQAVASSKAYSLVGGGHTLQAFEKFGIPSSKISHVSLAGGALLELMQGKELPAVKALEQAARKFGNKLK